MTCTWEWPQPGSDSGPDWLVWSFSRPNASACILAGETGVGTCWGGAEPCCTYCICGCCCTYCTCAQTHRTAQMSSIVRDQKKSLSLSLSLSMCLSLLCTYIGLHTAYEQKPWGLGEPRWTYCICGCCCMYCTCCRASASGCRVQGAGCRVRAL